MLVVGLFVLHFVLTANWVMLEKLWKTAQRPSSTAFLHAHSIVPDVVMDAIIASKSFLKFVDKTN
jgi:hypothetical protein